MKLKQDNYCKKQMHNDKIRNTKMNNIVKFIAEVSKMKKLIIFGNSDFALLVTYYSFCFIASNACINGYVNIKNNSFIGAGAVIGIKSQ